VALKKELCEMKKDDIVSIYNQDFLVERAVRLGMGNARNVNYRLKDGSLVKWFCVRDRGDEGLLALCDEIALETGDFRETLSHGGVDYTLQDKGSIRAVVTSAMGYPRYVNIEYFDYAAPAQGRYLFVQSGDGAVDAFAGETVIASAVMVFPASS
jgi:hypothetical protein